MLDGGPELRSRPGGSSLAATGHHKEISIGMLVAETNILKHIRGRSYRNVVIFLHEQINTADIDIQVRYVSGLLSEERGSCWKLQKALLHSRGGRRAVRSGRTAEDEWRASGVRGDAEPGRAWAAVSGVRGLAGPCAGGGGWDRPGRARAAVAADRDLGCENNKVLTGRGGHDIFAGGKNNIDIFGGKKIIEHNISFDGYFQNRQNYF
jgi:hypothetical protein